MRDPAIEHGVFQFHFEAVGADAVRAKSKDSRAQELLAREPERTLGPVELSLQSR